MSKENIEEIFEEETPEEVSENSGTENVNDSADMYKGQLVIASGVRMVEGKEYKWKRLADGTTLDVE